MSLFSFLFAQVMYFLNVPVCRNISPSFTGMIMAKAIAKSSSKSAKSNSSARATSKSKSKNSDKVAKLEAAADISLEQLDETGNRKKARPVTKERRKKASRRRQIDPTTCEREYNEAEIQFMHAMDEYKQLSGRMFPTCSEILEVLIKLGYRQVADVQDVYNPDADAAESGSNDGDDADCHDAEYCV